MRILDHRWGDLVGQTGSHSPSCGSTLVLDHNMRTRGLGQCKRDNPLVLLHSLSLFTFVRVTSPTHYHYVALFATIPIHHPYGSSSLQTTLAWNSITWM